MDARNPLFYRCTDLEAYVKELDPHKHVILLVNKADYLSPQLLQHWLDYFTENKIQCFFFSAKREQSILDGETVDAASPLILSRAQLLKSLKDAIKERYADAAKAGEEEQKRVTIGMVGYPNVGKSSVINVLVAKKKVSVSAQPGKTKHFQTIQIDEEDATLCDCPGLVFPSFTNSRAEMVCGGVISIDHSSDFDTPMILVVQRIPRHVLEKVYHVKLPDNDAYMSQTMFLQILARERGYVTGSSMPDVKKTAKMILKDYVTGKLLYCHLRPDYDATKHGAFEQGGVGDVMQEKQEKQEKVSEAGEKSAEAKKEGDQPKEEMKVKFLTSAARSEETVDKEFFAKTQLAMGSKLTKQERRQLKFAAKRGEVCYDVSLH